MSKLFARKKRFSPEKVAFYRVFLFFKLFLLLFPSNSPPPPSPQRWWKFVGFLETICEFSFETYAKRSICQIRSIRPRNFWRRIWKVRRPPSSCGESIKCIDRLRTKVESRDFLSLVGLRDTKLPEKKSFFIFLKKSEKNFPEKF